MKTIGMDIGTTTVCAVLTDAETGELLDAKTLTNDAHLKSERSWERIQNPTRILELCRQLLADYLDCYEDVESIGVTGAMHGILYTDKEGKAVSPLYTWQDQRGDQVNPESGMSYAKELSEITGYAMATGFGLTPQYYNTKHGLIPEEAVSFCTIPDYVAFSIAREKAPLLHQSMAASLGVYDIQKGCFDTEAIERAGMDIRMLPQVTKENALCGKTAEGIPVAVSLGDNQASFLGSVNEECKVLLNVGTGAQLSAYSEKIAEGENLECRPYVGDSWLLAGSALCGGYAYSLMKRFFEETLELAEAEAKRPAYEILNQAAAAAYEEEKQLTVDTRFNGTRQNPSITGSVAGITVDNFRPGHLALGVLKGICEELYQHYCTLPEESKGAAFFVGSGNGVRMNPLLQKICCDRFGMELKIPKYSEEAAYGASLFVLLACGKYQTLSEVQKLISYE